MSRTKKSVKKTGKPVKARKPGKAVKLLASELLRVNEETIARAASSFLEIGKALKAIRDQKQYTAARFKNFEVYCGKKWNYSESYASRLIGAYDTHELLKAKLPAKAALPNNEYQLRALAALPEGKRVRAWQQILKQSKGKPATGEVVEEAVKAILRPKGAGGKTARKTKQPAAASRLVTIGRLVKKALAKKAKASVTQLRQLLVKIQQLVADESN